MKIREIITKEELIFDKERNKVNEILTNLFNSKQKELENDLEEDCCVNSPLTYMQHHGGIDSTYYFGTKWGTVKVYVGDDPEDSKVEFLENQILMLINKPVTTTNEQPKDDNLKIELMKLMEKHVDLRNSDGITSRDLYHSFLDWEKELFRLIV